MGMSGQCHAPITLPQGMSPGTHCTGGWWDQGQSAENLAPSIIRSPDHPAHSKSLYCLHYPSPLICGVLFQYKQNIKLSSTHFSAGNCPPRHMLPNLEHNRHMVWPHYLNYPSPQKTVTNAVRGILIILYIRQGTLDT